MATLRRGSSGAEVSALQQKLGIKADGIFGPATEAAVKAYQQKNGLTADGIVGPNTQSKLGAGAAAPAKPGTKPAATTNKPAIPVQGYGFVEAFLNAHPDVKKIVADATKNGWTTDRFETALRGTDWYRTRTEAQRKWDVESAQDPTQAAQTRAQTEQKVRALAGQNGVTLTDQQVQALASSVYKDGADDLALRAALSKYMPTGAAEPPTSAPSVETLRNLAFEYGVPVSNNKLNEWARQIVAGTQTEDSLKGFFQTAATSMYPEFKAQLQAGMTTRDLLDPYLQMARSTLEIDDQQVNLTDPKWVPTQSTPEGTKVLSLQEWQKKLRTDPVYGFRHTAGARDEAYGLTARLGRLFGNYG